MNNESPFEIPSKPKTANDFINDVCELSVSRDANGLAFQIKSQVNWAAFFGRKDDIFSLVGVECFVPMQSQFPNIEAYFQQAGWQCEDMPNLAILLAKDISNGVTFNFGKVPVSEEKIIKWVAQFKNLIKNLYFTYVKPVNVHVNITAEIVEKEVGIL